MKELQAILKTWKETEKIATPSALATVVEVHGSSYRRPGARMLLSQDGHSVGIISGGCLDGDIWLRAREAMDSGQPILATYDTTDPDDIIWGSGVGCRGIIRILIEPLLSSSSTQSSQLEVSDLLAFFTESLESESSSVVATIYDIEDTALTKLGSRLMLGSDGIASNNIEDPGLASWMEADAREALSFGRSTNKVYETSDRKAEVFIEVISPPQPLLVFGAGPDAVPLVHLAHDLGWQITVVNTRPKLPLSERFEEAAEVIGIEPEFIASRISLNERTVVVVMTHNFLHDWELLKALLPSPVQYIGLLGPQVRAEELLRVLPKKSHTAGMTPTSEQLSRLHAPVGLDIGAETPEEIALSIIAEIKTHLSNRSGGFLRERKKRIHLDDNDK